MAKVQVELSLLVKLGSIAVHADEMISPDGREVDKHTLRNLLDDADVVKWIEENKVYLPRKRVGKDYDDRGVLGELSGVAPRAKANKTKTVKAAIKRLEK